ncbi:MAG: pantoate--beta-alanine ligase [Pseudomonadota bacterium]|nr:pantoate--beta-alanine ligase [Pseudomonadota bacterium]|tara:strand:+ start:1468 stop:2334 length:867 start_codon:yes stop_codon:yes gene_type:complete
MSKIFIIKTLADLSNQKEDWRKKEQNIALVPTMGNLHQGHMELFKTASNHSDKVICSIFVNPTQFEKYEDVDSYPRTIEEDRKKIEDQGLVDFIFLPTEDLIYPYGLKAATKIILPELSNDLCGAVRPNHFSGVASVILRLINLIKPELMILGDKDLQQKILISQMLQDMHYNQPKIISNRVVREEDGLAMSSRNLYLTTKERDIAPSLYKTLLGISESLLDGDIDFNALTLKAIKNLSELGFKVDYLTIRNEFNLNLPSDRDKNLVVMGAAYLGKTRLIDNIPVYVC